MRICFFTFYKGIRGIMSNENIIALIGECAPVSIIDALKREGFETLLLKKNDRLQSPVSSHADMLLFSVDNKIFISRSYASHVTNTLDRLQEYGYTFVLCDGEPECVYPYDILFNMAKIGSTVLGKMKYIDRGVKKYLREKGYYLENVNQGYTKCSTVILNDRAIITADTGIAKKAESCGIDVLLIENSIDSVKLDGYDYGFLGGACGLLYPKLYFCGNIYLHPCHTQILEFCASHKVELVSLTQEPLYDVGGIFFLKSLK